MFRAGNCFHVAGGVRRGRSRRTNLLLWLLLPASASAVAAPPTGEPSPRKAFVPADASAEWPEGRWNPVPMSVLTEFLRDTTSGGQEVRPAAYIEQAEFHGVLTEDLALEGTWSAVVRRPDGARPLIELGPVTPVLSELAWSGSPAVWGTDLFGRTLLHVDRPTGILSGRWSLGGQSVFDRVEYQVRIPPGASSRCEIAMPAGWRLRSSAGLVHEAQPADRKGWLLWTIDLGQHRESHWTLQKVDSSTAPALLCDRMIVYSIRPDGNRIQAEFAIQAFDAPATEIVFLLPRELRNPTVTYSTATNLEARILPDGNLQRLVVPVPISEPGRLGTFRIGADFPAIHDGDTPLPVVSLDRAVILRAHRRVDVDRPLTLRSLDVDGLRQSAVLADEFGTDWMFEELRPDGQIVIHVGRPQASLTALVATHVMRTGDGPRFHAVVSLQARTGSTFRTTLNLPRACDIVDVYPSAGIDNSGLSHWSLSHSGDTPALTVEFRQALQAQSPKQFEMIGWWMDPPATTLHVPAFPVPREADDWQILLAVSPGPGGTVSAGGAAARPIASAQIPSHWAAHLQVLRLAAADTGLTWFTFDGASPRGEILIAPAGADDLTRTAAASAELPPKGQPAQALAERPDGLALYLDLHSVISVASTASQWHDARYTLSAGANSVLTFALPEPAELDAVFVDRRGHAAEVVDGAIQLAPLPPDAREILVRYRTPPPTGSLWLRNQYRVPLPRWNIPVASLRWNIALPQGQCAAGSPPGVPVDPHAAGRSRLQNLLAPWLRPVGTPHFNPLSRAAWRNLLAAGPAANSSAAELVFVSLDPPSELALATWDERTVNRLAQLTLISCLACAVVVRRWMQRKSRIISAAAVAVVLLLALSVPDGYAPLAGGCLLGFTIGTLLPSRWLQQRDLLASWQFRRRSVPASAGGAVALLAVHCVWQPSILGQGPVGGPSPATPAAVSSATHPEGDVFDLLIPYEDAALAPAGYVETRMLPRFTEWVRREYDLPPYLIRSVEYEVSEVDPGLIRAVLDVVSLSDARRLPVVLPFRDVAFRSPEDCEVDGRRTEVRPEATGNGFVVVVEPTAPVAESAAGPHAALVPRQLEIAVWFQMIGSNGAGGFHCRVPPVNDAHLHLPAAVIDRGLRPSTALGAWRRDEQGNVDCDLGRADWLGIDFVDTEGLMHSRPTPLRADATTLVEVHPMRLQARTRIVVSPRSVESGFPFPQRLNLILPGRTEVRQVSSDSVRQFAVWHSGSAFAVLEIDFHQPLEAHQTIEFEYAVPFNPQVASEVPAIPLLDGDRLLSHRIGLRAAPGTTLATDRSAVVPGHLQEMLPELFNEGLTPDTVWSPPDAAFSILAPAPIPIRLTTLAPARSVTVEQSVSIDSRALRLEALAHVEVSGTQVFEHQLRIPAELRIDSLAVDQDGANRLLDWSRDGDRLVLHLREGRAGLQLLKLRGWLPLQAGEITRLPSLGFQEVTPRSSELILRNISGQSVELFSEGGAPVLPGFSAPVAATQAPIRRFAGPGPTVPISCRVAPASATPRLESMTCLELRDQAWTLTTTCRVEWQSAAPPTDLILQVPRELAPQFAVTPAEIVHSSQVKADGALELQLQWPDAGTAARVFEMTARVTPPEEPHWRLPLPAFPQVPCLRLLALAPDAGYVPDAATAVPVDPAGRLTASQEWLPQSITDKRSYHITADQVSLVATGSTLADTAAPALLETVVWGNADGTALGLTVVYLSAVDRPRELVLHLPGGVHVVGALDGDHVLETHPGDETSVVCTIQEDTAAGLRRIAFLWRRSVDGPGLAWTAADPLPVLKGLAVDRQYVAIVPPGGRHYFLKGASGGRPEGYRLARAEQLLQLIGGHSHPGRGSSAAHVYELARSLDTEIALLADVAWNDNRYADRFAALRARWNSIRDAAWLASAADTATDAGGGAVVKDQLELVSGALRHPDAILLHPAPDQLPLQFWSVGERAMSAVGGLLLALILLAAFIGWRILRRRRPVPGLGIQGDYLGLMVLGLFWWIGLRLEALGFALAVIAMGLQTVAWLRKNPARSAPVPSR